MGKICGKTDCPCFDNPSPIFGPIKSGTNKPKIVILTDSPESADYRRIFSGEMGNFIINALDKYGLADIVNGSFYYSTAIRCKADTANMSESLKNTALKCCKEFFTEKIQQWKPSLVISFGAMAMTQATKMKGIKDKQGVLSYSEEYQCHVLPMYAPGFLMRNMSHEGAWASGFNVAKNFIGAGWQPPKDGDKFTLKEVESIKGLFTKEQAADGIAIDTETQGLDWSHPLFTPISYSISPTDTTGFQIYLFEECLEHEKDYSILWDRKIKSKKVSQYVHVKRASNFENKMKELRWFLEDENIKKIMHNGSYDCHVFHALFRLAGRLLKWPHDKRVVDIRGYDFDTQNAAQLYNENMYGMVKLETLQKDFSSVNERYDSETFQKNADKSDMLSVPKELLTVYSVMDTITTKQVSVPLKKYLSGEKELQRYMERMVMPTVNMLNAMEENGAYVDVPALNAAKIDITALRDKEHQAALDLIPKAIIYAHQKAGLKLSRTALIRDAIYSPEGYNVKVLNSTKSGEPSTDQDTLTLLLDKIHNKKAKEFIHHLTEYKKYDTLAGRYLSGFEKHRKHDGRIHTRFSICQATTGRSNSASPNVQNIPNRGDAAKIIRRIISVPKGKKILKADASQAELRWMAHYAQDRAMMKIFRDGVIDIHTATAIDMTNFNDPTAWSRLNEKEQAFKRKTAKPVNFGYVYQMYPTSLITYAKVEYGVDMTEEEAYAYYDAYFKKYNGLPGYYDKMVAFGQKHGYVKSALGRRRRLPELNSKQKGLFSQAKRQAINFPIQSASSDSVLLAANEIMKMSLPKKDFKLILFIHDELVAEVREDCDIDKYARIMKNAIENPPIDKLFGVKLTVPLISEVEFGDNLNDCKKWTFK